MNASNQLKLLELFDTYSAENQTPLAFELAYQVRVAIDKIRFAITQIDSCAKHSSQVHEASLQLADTLDRLSAADRKFDRSVRVARTQFRIRTNGNGITGCGVDE